MNAPATGSVGPATNVGCDGQADGHAPPLPLASTVKLEVTVDTGFAGKLHGVIVSAVVAGPQASGLAMSPVLNRRSTSPIGTGGRPVSVAVSWPVV